MIEPGLIRLNQRAQGLALVLAQTELAGPFSAHKGIRGAFVRPHHGNPLGTQANGLQEEPGWSLRVLDGFLKAKNDGIGKNLLEGFNALSDKAECRQFRNSVGNGHVPRRHSLSNHRVNPARRIAHAAVKVDAKAVADEPLFHLAQFVGTEHGDAFGDQDRRVSHARQHPGGDLPSGGCAARAGELTKQAAACPKHRTEQGRVVSRTFFLRQWVSKAAVQQDRAIGLASLLDGCGPGLVQTGEKDKAAHTVIVIQPAASRSLAINP